MLTEKPEGKTATKPAAHQAAPSTDDLVAYFEGEYVAIRDAKVSIMTHAFMYGTAVFEGIRAYWNADQGVLYGLKLREHMERIRRNAGILLMHGLPPVDELVRIVVETIRRNGFREDAYIRPCYYKSGRSIGVRLHNLTHELTVLALPFGNYVDTDNGLRVMTSTWRRNADDALPARGKIVGGYVNMPSRSPRPSSTGSMRPSSSPRMGTPRRHRRRTCSSSATGSS